ncbi:Zn-dependent protease [Candidatus Scalindua japonica]|uniref:Zn-dependent protease n=1 Tax=Candidatus Scalindua japonica TaxID=1284222 RepID=A0A286TXK3_9BACT|nr:hypothetical protein [Candidatus Scalindua japonica]GAX60618.1 Zn-dependent protease [Candidatus Scalindua japonica]
MVKRRNKSNAKVITNQGETGYTAKAGKIGATTPYGYCSERRSPFGGLLGLVKFFDLIRFQEIFDKFYKSPSSEPALGYYNMVYGLLLLLFIGFNRVWHFIYIQFDSMLCSIFNVVRPKINEVFLQAYLCSPIGS